MCVIDVHLIVFFYSTNNVCTSQSSDECYQRSAIVDCLLLSVLRLVQSCFIVQHTYCVRYIESFKVLLYVTCGILLHVIVSHSDNNTIIFDSFIFQSCRIYLFSISAYLSLKPKRGIRNILQRHHRCFLEIYCRQKISHIMQYINLTCVTIEC